MCYDLNWVSKIVQPNLRSTVFHYGTSINGVVAAEESISLLELALVFI